VGQEKGHGESSSLGVVLKERPTVMERRNCAVERSLVGRCSKALGDRFISRPHGRFKDEKMDSDGFCLQQLKLPASCRYITYLTLTTAPRYRRYHTAPEMPEEEDTLCTTYVHKYVCM
jgi:hypothetical protein